MELRELLTKEYSISDLAALFRTDKFLKRDRLRFVQAKSTPALLAGERRVVAVPLRTLSVLPFSFPFGKKVSVRDALELRFRPILGAQGANLNVITQVTRQKSSETSGIAWFVSKDEIAQLEGQFGDAVLWPAPYLFASRVNGEGIVVCSYTQGSCGMVFAGGEPKLYRWLPAADGDAEALGEQLAAYGKKTFDKEFEILHIEPEKETALQSTGDATLALYPFAYGFNLSTADLSAKAETDKFVEKISHTGRLMALLGCIFLFVSLALLGVNLASRKSFTEAPSKVYAAALGERSENPLPSVLRKLRALDAEGAGAEGFETHFNRIAGVWKELAVHPMLDEMRYSKERIQISGTAAGASEIDALRKALADKGYNAVTENAQQLPKIGMRFTISLTEGKKQ